MRSKALREMAISLSKPQPLSYHLVSLIGYKKEVKILDVGSGPFPTTGQKLPGVKVNITWCDNKDFTDFWAEMGLVPNYLIADQDMEELTYADGSFDIVQCVNALDHTINAQAALNEMLRVVKPGGWIYIDCALDQLSAQGKKHYWDAKEDGRLINATSEIDLKDYGFEIQFIDNHQGERQYNHMIATKHA